jgi:phosphatidylserine/phosphatidylglycerophosphate/cardiolipin synthase-like enzyme
LAGTGELLAAIARARSVELASYVLFPGRLVTALERAAARGAAVRVRLEGAPADDPGHALAEANRRLARELRAHHVSVALTGGACRTHLKAAVVDGRAFLDDRNWPDDRSPSGRASTMIADDDPADVAVVRAGIAGKRAAGEHLWTTKGDALRAEAELLRAARAQPVRVETESFGPGAVARALAAQARAGCDVRLLVCRREVRDPRELAALRELAAAGVRVRALPVCEKLAVVGGRAWVGSANAGDFPAGQADWGMRVRSPSLAGALRARFDQSWNKAQAVASVVATTSSSGISSSSLK